MPAPIAVRLVPHDPRWSERAADEAHRIRRAVGDVIVDVVDAPG